MKAPLYTRGRSIHISAPQAGRGGEESSHLPSKHRKGHGLE